MNRNICTNKFGNCDEDRCECHSEEIKAEVELELAINDYNLSLLNLKDAIEKLGESNTQKLEAIEKVKPFLTELENLTK
jgi:hypothetical protein